MAAKLCREAWELRWPVGGARRGDGSASGLPGRLPARRKTMRALRVVLHQSRSEVQWHCGCSDSVMKAASSGLENGGSVRQQGEQQRVLRLRRREKHRVALVGWYLRGEKRGVAEPSGEGTEEDTRPVLRFRARMKLYMISFNFSYIKLCVYSLI
jgi:hypothetical protein